MTWRQYPLKRCLTWNNWRQSKTKCLTQRSSGAAQKARSPLSFALGTNQQNGEEMLRRFVIIALVSLLFSGCASVPMESETVSAQAKSFSPPADGNTGLYIYRSSGLGTAIKKDKINGVRLD